MIMWESVVCGVLTAVGIFLTYFVYRELKTAAELSKAFHALDEEVIRASKILNGLQKEEKR